MSPLPLDSKPIMVNRGIHNRVSKSFAPEGSLEFARNATYAVNDGALSCAKGRAIYAGGGHNASGLAPLAWDEDLPGTANGQRTEFLYTTGGLLKTIPASPNLAESAAAPAAATTLNYAFPAVPLRAIPFRDDTIVATDSGNFLLRRKEGAETAYPVGLPAQTVKPLLLKGPAAGGTPFTRQLYVWFTWYDQLHNVESAALDTAVGFIQYNSEAKNITFYVDAVAFDAAKPDSASHIRLYAASVNTNSTVQRNPFPRGSRLTMPTIENETTRFDIAISGILTTTNAASYPDGIALNRYSLVTDLNANSFYGLNGTYLFDLIDTPLATYPTVSIKLEGTVQPSASRNLPPPRFRTGAFFNGSFVVADLDVKGRYRWSFPDDPHAYPEDFFGDIEDAEPDEIHRIAALQSRVALFCSSGVHRLNFLPSAADISFREGKLLNKISNHGTVGPDAVAEFSLAGGAPQFAWLSREGMFITTVYETAEFASHVDFNAFVGANPANFATAKLVDDIENHRLILFYSPTGTIPTKALYIHYGASQIEANGGQPLVTGPIDFDSGIVEAFRATLADGSRRVITLTAGGNIAYCDQAYQSDNVLQDDTIVPLQFDVQTNRIYLAGFRNQMLTSSYWFHATAEIETELILSIIAGFDFKNIYQDDYTFLLPPTDDLRIVNDQRSSEWIAFRAQANASNFKLNCFGVLPNTLGPAQRTDI